MSDCAVILIKNAMPSATITSSGMSAAALANMQILRRNRFASFTAGTHQILFDLTSADLLDMFVVQGFGTGTTWRLELFAGAGQTGDLLHDSSTLVSADYIPIGVWRCGIDPYMGVVSKTDQDAVTLLLDAPVTPLSGRLTITDTSTMRIYYLMAGLRLSPASPGMAHAYERRSNLQTMRSSSGALIALGSAASWRVLQLPMSWLTEVERNTLLDDYAETGGIGAFVSALHGSSANADSKRQMSLIGNMTVPQVAQTTLDIHDTTITFEEY